MNHFRALGLLSVYLGGLAGLVLAILCLYWVFADPKPIRIESAWAVSATAQLGGDVTIGIRAAKFRNNCDGMSWHFVRDHDGIIYAVAGPNAGWADMTVGARDFFYSITLPPRMALGVATYWQTMMYRCNPLRTDRYRTPDIRLMILP